MANSLCEFSHWNTDLPAWDFIYQKCAGVFDHDIKREKAYKARGAYSLIIQVPKNQLIETPKRTTTVNK